tara:strand:- start:432 stop:2903 length:2472 start_codon:yes stop_codon:yes gene_type:complete
MSFTKCIDDGVAAGELSSEKADEIKNLFGDLEVQYNKQMGFAAASSKAAIDTSAAIKKISKEKKRRAMLQAKTWTKIRMHMDTFKTVTGVQDKYKATFDIFEQSVTSRFNSVAQVQSAVRGRATAKMDEFLGTFKRNLIGETKEKAKLQDVIREVFEPGSTNDVSARQMAEAWGKSAEYLRARYNSAGGAIPKRKDWGMPQFHNSVAVASAGFTSWRDTILPKLNVEKMLDEQTGLTFSPQKLELVLKDVFETIRTNGQNKSKPGSFSGNQSFASRHQDHRFLVFKNADNWMEYQKEFGNPNAFDVMMAHIDNMSRDIAMMEVMGPDPKTTLRFMKDTLTKEASLSGDAKQMNSASKSNAFLDDLYSATVGTNNAPVDGFLATTMAGTRNVLQSAQLGSAAVAAITDANFGRIGRTMNGLPQTKMLSNYLKLMNPLSLEEKGKLAVRIGLTAEGWTTLAAGQMRYVGEISGPEVTRRISDFVMRASLLSPWTQAGKWSFGMEYLGFLADNANLQFKDLPANMQKSMEHYNIGADKWEIIRKTPLYDYEGVKFLRAEDIEARADISPDLARDLATNLSVMIDTETNFAVPSSSLRGRVALTGDVRPGTLAGELTRSFAMYKNFGVTLVNTHIMRGLAQPTGRGKGAYFADLMISTTLMGALAMQLKEMAKGRDPRPMDTAEFWGAAFMQGGGLGIYGDFMFGNVNRYGGGLAETIAGPVIGFANDVSQLTVGNIMQAVQGDDTNAASEFLGFAGRYTPGSSLWYARLGLERLIIDQGKLWVDPDTKTKMRRQVSKYRTQYGQKYWWSPGSATPQRGPDVSKAFE